MVTNSGDISTRGSVQPAYYPWMLTIPTSIMTRHDILKELEDQRRICSEIQEVG